MYLMSIPFPASGLHEIFRRTIKLASQCIQMIKVMFCRMIRAFDLRNKAA